MSARQKAMFFSQPTTDEDVLSLWDMGARWLTRSQIAYGVNRKPHKALNDRIERLVSEGRIVKSTFTARNKTTGYIYVRADLYDHS